MPLTPPSEAEKGGDEPSGDGRRFEEVEPERMMALLAIGGWMLALRGTGGNT